MEETKRDPEVPAATPNDRDLRCHSLEQSRKSSSAESPPQMYCHQGRPQVGGTVSPTERELSRPLITCPHPPVDDERKDVGRDDQLMCMKQVNRMFWDVRDEQGTEQKRLIGRTMLTHCLPCAEAAPREPRLPTGVAVEVVKEGPSRQEDQFKLDTLEFVYGRGGAAHRRALPQYVRTKFAMKW